MKIKVIIFFLLFVLSLKGQAFNPFIKIDFPDYSIQDKKFQASLMLNQPYFQFTSIRISIISDKSYTIHSAKLKYQNDSKSLLIEKVSSTESLVYIPHKYGKDILANQLLLSLSNQKEGKFSYKVVVKYFDNDTEVYRWNSKDDFFNEKSNYEIEVIGNNKDYFLKFNKGINFSLNEIFKAGVNYFRLWFNLDSLKTNVFNIINNYNDTLLSVNVNRYQFLETITSENQIQFNQIFISKNSWYKFSLWFNQNDNKLNVFFNNQYLASIENIDETSFNQLKLKLESTLPIGIDEVSLKQIGNNTTNFAENNKLSISEYKNIKEYNFRNFNQERVNFIQNPYKVTKNGFGLSELNIELSINRFDTYIELNWEKNRFSKPSYFLIEKSTDGAIFYELSKIQELKDKENYSFLDYLKKGEDISYYRIIQINIDSTKNNSNTIKVGTGLTNIFDLKPNYPNPFNPITQISVEMFELSEVQILIYDVVGKQIATVFDGTLSSGVYNFQFDGSNFPSGLYFCEVKTPLGNQVQKMLLAK